MELVIVLNEEMIWVVGGCSAGGESRGGPGL